MEGIGSLGEAKMHDLEIGGGFRFITGRKVDDVGSLEVDLGIDVGGMETIKKVGNGRTWIRAYLCLFHSLGRRVYYLLIFT